MLHKYHNKHFSFAISFFYDCEDLFCSSLYNFNFSDFKFPKQKPPFSQEKIASNITRITLLENWNIQINFLHGIHPFVFLPSKTAAKSEILSFWKTSLQFAYRFFYGKTFLHLYGIFFSFAKKWRKCLLNWLKKSNSLRLIRFRVHNPSLICTNVEM